ncbi:hypothetical protein Tco_1195515 [Tanacetum coccineum]
MERRGNRSKGSIGRGKALLEIREHSMEYDRLREDQREDLAGYTTSRSDCLSHHLWLAMVLLGREPDPEVEVGRENPGGRFGLHPSQRSVTGIPLVIVNFAAVVYVSLDYCSRINVAIGAGVWFFLSRINALTISLSSATSGETAGLKEFVLTLIQLALLRD